MNYSLMNHSDEKASSRNEYCTPWTRVTALRCDLSFLVSYPFFFEEDDIEPTDEDELF